MSTALTDSIFCVPRAGRTGSRGSRLINSCHAASAVIRIPLWSEHSRCLLAAYTTPPLLCSSICKLLVWQLLHGTHSHS